MLTRGGIGSAGNTRILTHAEHWRTALLCRVACDARLQVLAGSRQRAQEEPCHPQGIVGDDSERGGVGALRQAQQRFPELACCMQLCSYKIKPPQTKQDRNELLCLISTCQHNARAWV